ncbi:hypothetical protein ABEF91_008340 [Exophiala dermatitidis]
MFPFAIPLIYAIPVACLLSILAYLRTKQRSQKKVATASSGYTTPRSAPETKDKKPDWDSVDFSTLKPIPDFDWRKQAPTPYRPWNNGPYHVTMGVKKTSLDDWVEIDNQYLDRYRYKRILFAEHPEETLAARPGSEEASFEALELLVDHLVHRYPSMFEKVPGGIRNLVVNETWDLRRDSDTWKSYHPLQVMGLLTTEDWFILQNEEDGQTRLKAGANCFPAGWKLRERMGLSLWQIHAGNVPQYEQNLAKSMDRFFLRLRVDSPIMRFNYAIDISPELFHINSHHNLKLEDLKHPLTLDHLHLRVERQFLQRLPKTRGIVFSIRTYITPITEVTKDREVAEALQTSINSYTDEIASYKNKHLWKDVLGPHLREVTAKDS